MYTEQGNPFPLNAPARTHNRLREFRLVNVSPVDLQLKQLKSNLVYSVVNDRAPRYLSDSINVTCKQHGRNTRSSALSLHVRYVKLVGQNSFYFSGTQAWNEFSRNIQKNKFKYLAKQFLFNNLMIRKLVHLCILIVIYKEICFFIIREGFTNDL